MSSRTTGALPLTISPVLIITRCSHQRHTCFCYGLLPLLPWVWSAMIRLQYKWISSSLALRLPRSFGVRLDFQLMAVSAHPVPSYCHCWVSVTIANLFPGSDANQSGSMHYKPKPSTLPYSWISNLIGAWKLKWTCSIYHNSLSTGNEPKCGVTPTTWFLIPVNKYTAQLARGLCQGMVSKLNPTGVSFYCNYRSCSESCTHKTFPLPCGWRKGGRPWDRVKPSMKHRYTHEPQVYPRSPDIPMQLQ